MDLGFQVDLPAQKIPKMALQLIDGGETAISLKMDGKI
jgi:hypothetical protein